jgi:hypothetical protein
MHLVFEPVVSRHYEVVLIPSVQDPEKPKTPAATTPPSTSVRDGGVSSTGSASEQPCAAEDAEPEHEDPYGSMEWPPSQHMVHVFSSRTGRWEERVLLFVLEKPPERWPTCGWIPMNRSCSVRYTASQRTGKEICMCTADCRGAYIMS